MNDPVPHDSTDPQSAEIGWVVLDPDGNVVDSGPGMVLEMAATMSDQPEHETTQEG